jgi:beta-glucosidase
VSAAGGRPRTVAAAVVVVVVVLAGCTGSGDREERSASPAATSLVPTSTTDPAGERDPTRCPGAPWMAPGVLPEERARRLVATLTLEQKVAQLHGAPRPDDFRIVPGIPELCVPDLTVTNGPAGVGPSITPAEGVPATALPAPIAVAATWDAEAAGAIGAVMGDEIRQTGRNLLESPAVDVARVPYNGRTFESFGEDPLLASAMAVAQIRAVQERGVIAMVKHFVANNQEQDRQEVDAVVGERALRELYLPPFEAAVRDAEVASVMCAYNRVNGAYSCENEPLLTGVLRDDWGFEGFVQSDFGATHSTEGSVRAGMDLEMPFGLFYGDPMRQAVQEGRVSIAEIDRMLLRRFTPMFRLGLFDRTVTTAPIPVDDHARIARTVAEQGTVLLRNEDRLLPLDDGGIDAIAVVGPWADRAATGGGGSSRVTPIRPPVTPLEGIRSRVGAGVDVRTPTGPGPAEAAAAAADADVAVVVVGEQLTEGSDRTTLSLPDDQDALIEAVAAVNDRTVVVLHIGAPVLVPWLERVDAVLVGWYPGQEDGAATARVLFGDADPGGRLPVTFPAAERTAPADTPARYPGVDGAVRYDEGLATGYRAGGSAPAPRFPFGFGLSYTSFALDRLEAPDRVEADDAARIRVRVRNVGARPGSEVVQVYVRAPDDVGPPGPVLAGFAKVHLDAGETAEVTVELSPRAFLHWDVERDDWTATTGVHQLLVGTAAGDTPLRAEVVVRS